MQPQNVFLQIFISQTVSTSTIHFLNLTGGASPAA